MRVVVIGGLAGLAARYALVRADRTPCRLARGAPHCKALVGNALSRAAGGGPDGRCADRARREWLAEARRG